MTTFLALPLLQLVHLYSLLLSHWLSGLGHWCTVRLFYSKAAAVCKEVPMVDESIDVPIDDAEETKSEKKPTEVDEGSTNST